MELPVRAVSRRSQLLFLLLVIELANGIGHITIAALSGGYFAGAWTKTLSMPLSSVYNLMMDRKNRERIGPSAVA